MKEYTATEQAYKNGYEAGVKDLAERLKASQIINHKSKEGYCVYEFDDELIDNLVEEMTVNYESSKNDEQRKDERK